MPGHNLLNWEQQAKRIDELEEICSVIHEESLKKEQELNETIRLLQHTITKLHYSGEEREKQVKILLRYIKLFKPDIGEMQKKD